MMVTLFPFTCGVTLPEHALKFLPVNHALPGVVVIDIDVPDGDAPMPFRAIDGLIVMVLEAVGVLP